MSKVLVLGRGQMGRPIADAMRKFGHEVWTVDQTEPPKSPFQEFKEDIATRDILGDLSNGSPWFGSFLDELEPDIVISALPYFLNQNMAEHCIHRSIMYCDLGGHVETSAQINSYAEHNNQCVFTDLGLAPGLVNIMAHRAWDTLSRGGRESIDAVNMYCGGIPARQWPQNPLNYFLTWSGEGLYNEYKDTCKILKDWEIVEVQALEGTIQLTPFYGTTLEAFYTSGAASHSLEYFRENGVRSCSYRTMRWPGHRRIISFLLDTLDKQGFLQIIEKVDRDTIDREDVVYIHVEALATDTEGFQHNCTKSLAIIADGCGSHPKTNELSAMQKATALPCAAIADWMIHTKLGYKSSLKYHDIATEYCELIDRLNHLGIQLHG